MSITLHIQTKYLPGYNDPRTMPSFPSDCYPAEQGGESAVPENVQEAKAMFKAVYARRNACLRDLSRLPPGDPARPPLAEQVLFLTEAIDHLEDVYAPIGLVAEPVMGETMFTSELIFTHAPLTRGRSEPFESSFSFYIPIPLADLKGKDDPNAS